MREVEGEAVRIEEGECLFAVHGVAACLHGLFNHAFKQRDACREGAEEGLFFFFHHAADECLLRRQFGIGAAHFFHEGGQETVEEGFALAEEGVGVAHGAAQDAADHVACLGVRGQLPVGNREGNGTQVVGHYAHGHVGLFFFAVGIAGEFAYLFNDGLEHVGVVVGMLVLHHAHEAFETHTRVDHLMRQRLERTVGLAVVLHEHEVPDFDNLRIIFVHEFGSRHGCALFGRAAVDMYFGARAARAGVAHFPEVVVLIAVDDVAFREEASPESCGFAVALEAFFLRALEHGNVKVLGVDFQHVHEKLVGPRDGFFLEVVAKAPVAEHFKHGVVVRVVAHLFEVVVLAAHAQAFLRVGLSAAFRFGVTENDILELVHAGIGEHERGVVFDHHRCGGHDEMSFRFKELLVGFAYFVGSHIA